MNVIKKLLKRICPLKKPSIQQTQPLKLKIFWRRMNGRGVCRQGRTPGDYWSISACSALIQMVIKSFGTEYARNLSAAQ